MQFVQIILATPLKLGEGADAMYSLSEHSSQGPIYHRFNRAPQHYSYLTKDHIDFLGMKIFHKMSELYQKNYTYVKV